MSKKVLVIGGGGREHALLWKLAQSPRISTLYCAPGNGGTENLATTVAIPVSDHEALIAFAQQESIDLVVVGPDDPLATGIVDAFQVVGIAIFGPTKAAAHIEASKAFSKQLMKESSLPTATFQVFTDCDLAKAYVQDHSLPVVIKASGLALGKGVYICSSLAEAETALVEIMQDKLFGGAGNEVVIEEFLEGQEVSIHAISDGKNVVLFPSSQDHKPIGEGDIGLNTGGMGTYSPVPWVTEQMLEEIKNSIVVPTIENMAERGRQFRGCLYPGLKMTKNGPKILEYNARFGDPETQVYMRLLKTDLLDLIEASIEGRLDQITLEWHSGFAVCIVAASGGYPGSYQKGMPIKGIEKAESIKDIVVFHAGTEKKEGVLQTSGGRVLGVTSTGKTLPEALENAYQAMAEIQFEGMYYRRDIAQKAL